MNSKPYIYLKNVYYSFPLQLVLLHLQKHPLLLTFWLLLFGAVWQFLGVSYGIPLLFLDPEYLGNVNFLSFLVVGFAMGGFITAWNVSFYILNSYRFEFLASLVNPFVQFCLNNSIIPLLFTIGYIVQVIKFQHTESLFPAATIVANVLALLLGNLLMVLATSSLFIFFNRDVESFLNTLSDKAKESLIGKKINLDKIQLRPTDITQWRVETYLVFPFRISQVRKVDFYDRKLVERVLFLHHRNAFVFQLVCIAGLLGIGWMMENPYFRLPAGAAIFLILSVITVMFSFISYFFRSWAAVAVVTLIIGLNILTKYDLVVYKHQLYGLDYKSPKKLYNNEIVNSAVSEQQVRDDMRSTMQILDNWHRKIKSKYGNEKPKLLFINTAGGGLKASYWTFHVLQELEKETGKKLFDHTVLLTGASGGMLGSAYFRELYLRTKNNEPVDYTHKTYLDDIGQDLLNGVATSIATNDIFYPWQSFDYNGHSYKKDRAYMFNVKLNENTHYMMYRNISDYKVPERQSLIPMMIMSATIINDQRFLLFSPQDVSYLVKPYSVASAGYKDNQSVDAVEYAHFFQDKGAASLNFVDALRTNATYPYIMPQVILPTKPEIKAMDAGIRDNSGLAISTRFYNVFKDWIDENTAGVIFISIRVDNKQRVFDPKEKQTYISELLSPVGSIFNNFLLLQDYNSDISLTYLENAGNTPIHVLNFNYDQTKKRKKASMSWHLTTQEKMDIQQAFEQDNNVQALAKLKELLR